VHGQDVQTLSYLLRLWSTGSDEERTWRVSLMNARTGEMQGFDSLEALCHSLQEQISDKESTNKGLSTT
jgi:hypothetical protein